MDKEFLDFEGLALYDSLLNDVIDEKDDSVLHEATSGMTSLENKVNKNTSAITEVNNKVNTLKTTTENGINAISGSVSSLKTQFTNLSGSVVSEINDVETRVNRNTNSISTLGKNLNDTNNRVSNTSTTVSSMNTSLTNRIKNVESDVEVLNTETAENTGKISVLEEVVNNQLTIADENIKNIYDILENDALEVSAHPISSAVITSGSTLSGDTRTLMTAKGVYGTMVCGTTDVVKYNTEQSLNNTQKNRARKNIGIDGIPVTYSAQTGMTDAQKAQARRNIGIDEDEKPTKDSTNIISSQWVYANIPLSRNVFLVNEVPEFRYVVPFDAAGGHIKLIIPKLVTQYDIIFAGLGSWPSFPDMLQNDTIVDIPTDQQKIAIVFDIDTGQFVVKTLYKEKIVFEKTEYLFAVVYFNPNTINVLRINSSSYKINGRLYNDNNMYSTEYFDNCLQDTIKSVAKFTDIEPYSAVTGYYMLSDGTQKESSSIRYNMYMVEPKKAYAFTSHLGSSLNFVVWLDEYGNSLGNETYTGKSGGITHTDKIIFSPENAGYVAINYSMAFADRVKLKNVTFVNLNKLDNECYYNKTVAIDVANRSITLPQQTYNTDLILNGSGTHESTILQGGDVTITLPSTWNHYHIVYDKPNDEFIVIPTYKELILGAEQYYFANIRFIGSSYNIYKINAFSYTVNGKKISNNEIDDVPTSGSSRLTTSDTQYWYGNEMYYLYNIEIGKKVENGNTIRYIKIPKQTVDAYFILSNDRLGWHSIALSQNDVVLEYPTGTYGTKHIIYDKEQDVFELVNAYHKVITDKNKFYFGTIRISEDIVPKVTVFRLNALSYALVDVVDTKARQYDTSFDTIQMTNPHIDLRKGDLKILDIGNSYTLNSTQYLSTANGGIIRSAGGDMTSFSLYRCYRSGASFKNYVDFYNGGDNLGSYSIDIKGGKTLSEISGDTITSVSADEARPHFKNVLEKVDWDVIVIHQVSTYANQPELWDGTTAGGYLNEFIEILKETNPQAMIGFDLIHSYSSDYTGNTEHSSTLRWKNICGGIRKATSKYGIDFIIPYGTAVQLLRKELPNSDEYSTDGTHLGLGLGCYVASCCYYQAVFAPHFGKSVVGNTYRPTIPEEQASDPGTVEVTEINAKIAQKAAMKAVSNWFAE